MKHLTIASAAAACGGVYCGPDEPALLQREITFLTTDSRYVVDSITKRWVYGWKKRGWIKSDKKPALNVDLWEKLLPLLEIHQVQFNWVKGHAGHPENERCDRLAVAQRDKYC